MGSPCASTTVPVTFFVSCGLRISVSGKASVLLPDANVAGLPAMKMATASPVLHIALFTGNMFCNRKNQLFFINLKFNQLNKCLFVNRGGVAAPPFFCNHFYRHGKYFLPINM
jgi:hypothetical protein